MIRADLSPLEEARAYRRLVDEHGDAAKVAKLVGKSERLVCERLELLRLPERTQEPARRAKGAARLRPEPRPDRGARAAARGPDGRVAGGAPARRGGLPADPGDVVDDVLAAEWTDDDGEAAPPGRLQRRRLPRPDPPARLAPARRPSRQYWRSSASTARRWPRRSRRCRRSSKATSTTGRPARREERRERECFALGDADADAARAFGCLLELRRGERPRSRATSPTRSGSRIVSSRRSPPTSAARRSEKSGRGQHRAARAGGDDAEKEARREQRQRDYEARVSARARNLDLGAALARWEPKLDTDAVKLLGSLVLLHYGKAAAWAHRLCVEQPTTTNKQGKVTVRYPRGAQAEKELHEAAIAALMRARHAGGRPRGRPAAARRAAARGHGRTPRTPIGKASTSRSELTGSAVLGEARHAGRAALRQAAPCRTGGRARAARAGLAGRAGRATRGAAREARRRRSRSAASAASA